jgi:RNA polymerase sigma-70 factor (ECF subfamily)
LSNQESGFFAEINTPEFLGRLRRTDSEGKKAFRSLVTATHDALMQYARRQLSSQEDCQECVQETFLAVHQGIDRFQGNSKLTTWIWSLAHHKVCDRLSDKHRRRLVSEEPDENALSTDSESDVWETPTAWDARPDRQVDSKRAQQYWQAAIASLGQPSRDVYLLRDGQGLTGEQVAEILNLSLVNVRVHLHRARHKIVEYIRLRLHVKDREKPAKPVSTESPSSPAIPLFGGPEP